MWSRSAWSGRTKSEAQPVRGVGWAEGHCGGWDPFSLVSHILKFPPTKNWRPILNRGFDEAALMR